MTTSERLVVHTLGRFELRRHLGRGAMGDVDLAWDPHTDREVALKWMRIDTSDPDALEAERNGAELQRRVAAIAPSVAEVFEYGELEDSLRGRLFYVAMEHVNGTDLVEVLRDSRGRALGIERSLRLAIELVGVLKTLHEFQTEIDGRLVKSVLHGDIKPENLRLQPLDAAPGERLRILDFGVAKHLTLTRQATRNLFGSYPYTPPERLRTGMVDERSDIWAAGIILYQMLAGSSPYDGQTPEQLERQVRTQPATPLERRVGKGVYSEELCWLVDRCLDFEAESRFESARSLHDALEAVRETELQRDSLPESPVAASAGPRPQARGDTEATRRTTPEMAAGLPPTLPSLPTPETVPTSKSRDEEPDLESTRRTVATAAPVLPPLPVLPPVPGRRREPAPSAGEIGSDVAAKVTTATRRTVPPPTKVAESQPVQAAETPAASNEVQGEAKGRRQVRRQKRTSRWRRNLWIVAIVFLVLQYSAHNARRSVIDELTTEASPDIDAALSTYRFAARMRPFDFGLSEPRNLLSAALVERADQVIRGFVDETSSPRQGDWQRATHDLEVALELGLRDPTVRSKLYYSQAHDDRIEARSAWNRRDRAEAQRLWERSIHGFERAAALDETWPDPFLGLARIYAYEVFDLPKLENSLREALGRGYTWADREKAQLADAHRTEASRQLADANDLEGERRERQLLLDARRHLELAISMYEQILDFGNARQNRDLALASLEEIRDRLRSRRRL